MLPPRSRITLPKVTNLLHLGKIVEFQHKMCRYVQLHISPQRSVHLFLRLAETSIILESFVFDSELLPVVQQKDKNMTESGAHILQSLTK